MRGALAAAQCPQTSENTDKDNLCHLPCHAPHRWLRLWLRWGCRQGRLLWRWLILYRGLQNATHAETKYAPNRGRGRKEPRRLKSGAGNCHAQWRANLVPTALSRPPDILAALSCAHGVASPHLCTTIKQRKSSSGAGTKSIYRQLRSGMTAALCRLLHAGGRPRTRTERPGSWHIKDTRCAMLRLPPNRRPLRP